MSRIRTIKPDAFRSETLAEVSLTAERTFFGLLTEVDDEGRIKERPAVLNGALWSLRPEHTVQDMVRDLDELQREDLICRYSIGSAAYFHLPTFRQHQKINRPTASKIEGCPACPPERGGVATGSATEGEDQTLPGFGGATVTPLPVADARP